uniref:PAS domain-containing protein n=1 Tax=Oryza meridionalis TaxID=40149 RepID=A0A0E0BYE1_9ORYZ
MEGAEAEERRLAASLTARYSDWVVEALDELPGSFILTDPAMPGHPIVYASRGLASLTGYPPREVLGRNARLFQGADTDRAAVAGVREAVRGQRPHQVSILNYRRDGEAHWVLLHLAPVFHAADGRVLHFLAVQVPIAPPTSRRRTPPCRAARPPVVFAACREEARVEEECPCASHAGEVFVDVDKRGYSREEILGCNCRFLNGPGTSVEVLEQINQHICSEQACTVHLLNYRKGGSSFRDLLHISPIRNASGKVAFHVWVHLDEGAKYDFNGLTPEVWQLGAVGAVRVAVRSLSASGSLLRPSQ